jgi:hypothetical protein
MCESTREKVAFAVMWRWYMAHPRITGLSCSISASCAAFALPLTISLTLSSKDLMLFFAGLVSSWSPYFRKF